MKYDKKVLKKLGNDIEKRLKKPLFKGKRTKTISGKGKRKKSISGKGGNINQERAISDLIKLT